ARRRLLRQSRQSHGADHGRGARRADIAVRGGGRACPRAAAAVWFLARSWTRATQGFGDTGACLSACPSASAAGFSGAAFARNDAEQPSAADFVVCRTWARNGRGQAT